MKNRSPGSLSLSPSPSLPKPETGAWAQAQAEEKQSPRSLSLSPSLPKPEAGAWAQAQAEKKRSPRSLSPSPSPSLPKPEAGVKPQAEEKQSSRGARVGWCIAAGGLPFLLYLRTMAPTVYALDSAELTTGAYVLGIVHAPGSPAFLLLGHLFSKLPIGDVGFRVNLLSACSAALTCSLVYLLNFRLVRNRALALGGAWFLAVSYYFWISALAAELYAPQACFLAALLLLASKWYDEGRPLHLYAIGFLFGLGLGFHLSLVLVAPGLAWVVLGGPRPLPQPVRLVGGVFVCALLGASIYGYLPVRYASDTPLNYARDYWQIDLTTVKGFIWMVTGRMFAASFFGVPFLELPREVGLYVWRLWSNFIGLGALLGVVGLAEGLRRKPALHAGLLLMLLTHTIFFLFYRAADKELMFLPTYLIWSVWIVLGSRWAVRDINRSLTRRWAMPAWVLLMFMVIGTLGLNFGRVDLSRDRSARISAERILKHMPDGATYLGTWADVPVLEYLQIVERRWPDVTVRNLPFLRTEAIRIAEEHLGAGVRVYTSVPQLIGGDGVQFTYSNRCECYAVEYAKESGGSTESPSMPTRSRGREPAGNEGPLQPGD